MTIRISRMLSPITVLGPGRRVALWVQGCSLACAGCSSVDTWDPASGTPVSVEDCARQIINLLDADPTLTGLSVTGGEPVQQGAQTARLIDLVRQECPAVDVLLFTGYALPAAVRVAPALVGAVDAVVAGPYRSGSGYGGPLLGSSNQKLHLLTPLAAERFGPGDLRSGMQVTATRDELVMVGIPRPGDLELLETKLGDRGISFGDVTWRS